MQSRLVKLGDACLIFHQIAQGSAYNADGPLIDPVSQHMLLGRPMLWAIEY